MKWTAWATRFHSVLSCASLPFLFSELLLLADKQGLDIDL